MPRNYRFLLAALLALSLGGCASIMRSAQQSFVNNLSAAVKNHDDPATVEQGLAAYLLLADASVQGSPNDPGTLCGAAGLYGSYAGAFATDDPARALRLSERALRYASTALCARDASACDLRNKPFAAIEAWVDNSRSSDALMLGCLGTAWTGWIQVRTDDFSAIADVPKVKKMFEKLDRIDPGYDGGVVQLYLGVLSSLLPPAYGGKPELGAAYFERAIAASDGRNLMAKALYAQYYARLVFDQALHDRLLTEVLDSPVEADGLTFSNAIAKTKAAELLASGKDYF